MERRQCEEDGSSTLLKDSVLIQPSCGICFMPILENKSKAVLQPCLHSFHFECIDRWLSLRGYCAYCRTLQPHVRHNFVSSIEYSIKFYETKEEQDFVLDDEDMEILDVWEEGLDDAIDQEFTTMTTGRRVLMSASQAASWFYCVEKPKM